MLLAPTFAGADDFGERIAACLACHGEEGRSGNAEVPSLGGQPASYLLTQIYLFRERIRPVEVMNQQTQGLSDDDLRRFSDFLAGLPPPVPPPEPPDAARMARGQALVAKHHCASCHAPKLAGQDQIPRLAGQREDYIVKALRDYKSGARPGYDPAMASVVAPLTDEDFVVLSYYAARVK